MPREFHVQVNKAGPGLNLILRWTNPNTGERCKRTAGTTDRKEAARQARDLELELIQYSYSLPGEILWEDFVQRYDEEYLSSLAVKTQQGVASVFRIFKRLCKPRRLSDVSAGCLSRFQAKLRETARSEATIKTYLAHLQGALHWAVDVGMLRAMPKVPKLRRAKQKARSKIMGGRPITTEEFERMLAKVPVIVIPQAASSGSAMAPGPMPIDAADQAVIDAWRYYLEGLWWSGLRLAESLQLYWNRPDRLQVYDLDGPEPMFLVRAELEKGHEDRILPMAPEFAEFLRMTPEAARKGPVFRLPGIRVKWPRGGERAPVRRLRSAEWVSRIVSRIGKAARVKVGTRRKRAKDGSPMKVLVPKYVAAHDLRRSFGERWAGRIMPHELQQLMRHQDIQTTMRYYVGKNSRTVAVKLWRAYEAAGASDPSRLNRGGLGSGPTTGPTADSAGPP